MILTQQKYATYECMSQWTFRGSQAFDQKGRKAYRTKYVREHNFECLMDSS